MKTKIEVAILASILSIPAFVAGWHWSSGGKQATEQPVKKVIEAIESARAPANDETGTRLQTAAIFDSLHERTVASFIATFNSFGISRVMKAEDMRHTDLWTLHPGRSDGFEVSLIGLDRETPVRYVRSSPPGETDPAISAAATLPAGLFRIQNPDTKDQTIPLDRLDLAGVEQLQAPENNRRAIFAQHDSLVAFGPIRSEESCLRCHDGEPEELLGVFRYTFPLPGQSLKTRLAGNP